MLERLEARSATPRYGAGRGAESAGSRRCCGGSTAAPRRRGDEPRFLLTVVIGLVVVNVSCYMALEIGRLHARSHGPNPIAVPGPTFGQIATSGLPGS